MRNNKSITDILKTNPLFMKFYEKKELRQVVKFLMVGVLNTIVGYGLYVSCLYFLKCNYFIASTISYIIGVTHAFFWHKLWTFRSKGHILKELAKFISMTFMNSYLLYVGIITLLVEITKLNPYVSGAIATGFCAIISYLLNRYWIFRKKENAEKTNLPE